MKKYFAVILVLFFMSLPLLAEEKTVDLTPKFWAYFQPQSEWTPTTRSFSISKGRGFVVGNLAEKISYLVEVESVPMPTLVKANISYNFTEALRITIGQQSSAFKFFNPDPSKRYLAVYALSALCPPLDDIGMTFEGRISLFDYRFSVLNGTGTNRKDDNKDKDALGWIKFSPAHWFSLIACYQGGYQGIGMSRKHRSGEWLQLEVKPFSWLSLKPTWVKRNDLEKDDQGWFVLSQVQINSKYQLLVQYLNDYNFDKEWTIGGIIGLNKRTRFLPNIYYRVKPDGKKDVGLYIVSHINIGKDI